MKVLLSGTPEAEVMGLFGLSWAEKVASAMQKYLKGTASAKLLKSFWQAGGKNVTLVNNLHREYVALMASGYAPSDFKIPPNADGTGGEFSSETVSLAQLISNKTKVTVAIVLEFLRAIFVLARDGKIPFAKWNPAGYKQSTALQKTFVTERGFKEAAANYMKIALVLAALGVGAYVYNQLKESVK